MTVCGTSIFANFCNSVVICVMVDAVTQGRAIVPFPLNSSTMEGHLPVVSRTRQLKLC